MPNNTVAYLDGNDPTKKMIDYRINTDERDTIISYFEPNNCSVFQGTIPRFLVKYDEINKDKRYLSGYNPKKVELIFDFVNEKYISHLELLNYYDEITEKFELSKRGVKETKIYYALEDMKFKLLTDYSFNRNTSGDTFEKVDINQECRYIKILITPIQGVGNHYLESNQKEIVFGINKVKFYTDERLLKDIHITCTSIMSKDLQKV